MSAAAQRSGSSPFGSMSDSRVLAAKTSVSRRPRGVPRHSARRCSTASPTVPLPSRATFAGVADGFAVDANGLGDHRQASFRRWRRGAIERGDQVGDEVVGMLDADRQAQQARVMPASGFAGIVHRRVGHGRRMRDQAFDAAEGFGQA